MSTFTRHQLRPAHSGINSGNITSDVCDSERQSKIRSAAPPRPPLDDHLSSRSVIGTGSTPPRRTGSRTPSAPRRRPHRRVAHGHPSGPRPVTVHGYGPRHPRGSCQWAYRALLKALTVPSPLYLGSSPFGRRPTTIRVHAAPEIVIRSGVHNIVSNTRARRQPFTAPPRPP